MMPVDCLIRSDLCNKLMGNKAMADDTPHDLKAVYWRSRRGMQELEVKLLPFLRDCYRALPEPEQRAYDALLAEEDWQLFDWLQDRGQPEDAVQAAVMEKIKRYEGRL